MKLKQITDHTLNVLPLCAYPRIGRLPTFVQPEGTFALCVTLRIQAFLAHVHSNVLHGFGQHIVQLLQMHVALLIHDIGLVENAVHVAFESSILMDFTVAELSNSLCKNVTFIFE